MKGGEFLHNLMPYLLFILTLTYRNRLPSVKGALATGVEKILPMAAKRFGLIQATCIATRDVMIIIELRLKR